jgi:hypothetical protein
MGGVHSGARALHVLNLILFGYIAIPVGRRLVIFIVQMNSTCLATRVHVEEGGGGRHPVDEMDHKFCPAVPDPASQNDAEIHGADPDRKTTGSDL